MVDRRLQLRVGLPYLPHDAGHPFLCTVRELGSPCLISVGSLYRPATGWRRLSPEAWRLDVALDSAGFVATARFGGYRWSIAEYVAQVATNFACGDAVLADRPHPWAWWSQMDLCCEPEIAHDRAEVQRRVVGTVSNLIQTLDEVERWCARGAPVPRPLPVLQGREPEDYVRSAELLQREVGPLPELVGVGSVCRRPLGGRDGLLRVVAALDEALPPHVRLHLFGVKGGGPQALGALARRVASVDSSAWDEAARRDAQKMRRGGASYSCTLDHRTSRLRAWVEAHRARADLLTWSPR